MRAVSVSGEISAWNQEVAFRILTPAEPRTNQSPNGELNGILLMSLPSPFAAIDTDRGQKTSPVRAAAQAQLPTTRDADKDNQLFEFAETAGPVEAGVRVAVGDLNAVMSEFLVQDFTLRTTPTDRR